LLVATILSAQSTDETVNKVTPLLFKQYSTPRELAVADPSDVERLVRPAGFFRQKTKSIMGAAQRIMDEFGGQVPDSMDGLLTLPGVARKTANVVLGTWFGKNEGIVVDTHVGRLAGRLALAWNQKDSKDARTIEQDLMKLIPRKDWTYLGHALIWHGRRVCTSRKPACAACGLAKDCPSAAT
jgi:endonuclease-3